MPRVPYRFLVQNSGEGVLLIGDADRVLYANEAACELLGRIDQLGAPPRIDQFLAPADRGVWESLRRAALRGERTGERGVQLIGPGRRLVPARIRARGLDDGQISLYLRPGRSHDDELRRSEQRYRTLFEQANDAVFLETLDGRIIDVNRRACELLGYSRKELMGLTVADITPPEVQDGIAQSLDDLLSTGGMCLESINVHKDGTLVPVEVSLRVLRGDAEPLLLTLVRDISERKRMEDERARMEEHLLHAHKAEGLGIMSAGLAHDFNNILMGIQGFAELALQGLSRHHPSRDAVERIGQATRRATALTQQLLAYAGRGHMETEAIDLDRLVDDLIDVLRSSVSKKVVIERRFEEGPPPVLGNPSNLRQLVMNLLLNAGEAIGDRPGTLTVRTGCEELTPGKAEGLLVPGDPPEGPCAVLEISDDGCGMDEETRARIFDPFFSSKRPGRGLGLAAVYGVVKRHGGALRVTSRPGEGTTLRVILPAAECATQEPAPPQAGLPRGDETILFVDDEENVRRVAAEALGGLGYRVEFAENGAQGLDRFVRCMDQLDLVIVDVMMPVLGGVELLQELKRIRPDVKVILSSGYNELDTTRDIAQGDLAGFLQKPYSLQLLAEKVRTALDE